MLNFRKLRQDFSSAMLKEGGELFKNEQVLSVKVLDVTSSTLKVSGQIKGSFGNTYETEVELDRQGSEIIDSNCDCPYSYDCQHLAAMFYFLEKNLDKILNRQSKAIHTQQIDQEKKQEILQSLKTTGQDQPKKLEPFQKESLEEYKETSRILSQCPLFLPEQPCKEDQAELLIIFIPNSSRGAKHESLQELQLALRLPARSKPMHVPNVSQFLEAIKFSDPLSISGKRFLFTRRSFDDLSQEILQMVLSYARFETGRGKQRSFLLESEALGAIFAKSYQLASEDPSLQSKKTLSRIHLGNLEEPLFFSTTRAALKFNLEKIDANTSKLFLIPKLLLKGEEISYEQVCLFTSDRPGLLYEGTFYAFEDNIRRSHLKMLCQIRDMTIPESLFGTFIENSLPELLNFAHVGNQNLLEKITTLPFVDELKARCKLSYLEGELDARLSFFYGDVELPSNFNELSYKQIRSFVTQEGIVARDLFKEQKILGDLFEGFIYLPEQGSYQAKTEKKIVEFMTAKVPAYKESISFECPENLTDQFMYDDSLFSIELVASSEVNVFNVQFGVKGGLEGVSVDLLWDCVASKKNYIELEKKAKKTKSRGNSRKKILVLDLEVIKPLVQLFDEFGIRELENGVVERPLWSLVTVDPDAFNDLPITFSMKEKLNDLQQQMLGKTSTTPSPIPEAIKVELRNYQIEGVQWLEKLRRMHLGGVLADDMGLGKTLQAICALTQDLALNPNAQSLVVCPTSLLYNWEEECHKFNPELKVLVIDGLPHTRKSLLKKISQYHLVITSYSLLQKDVEIYRKQTFSYVILDEAQHIKNRLTLNAKSVKQIKAANRLILTGTPIENCLEEIWSLFDFLMPGLLSTYDRFVDKYIRSTTLEDKKELQKKTAPFILRRLKADVLDDLPPISELIYHCHLSDYQKELYKSYACSAREELEKLVEQEGFDNIRIHVLATLTRLKQICCHPSIFSHEELARESCAKYDMLLELLQTLNEGGHKTVVFSQYTRMLSIIKDGLTDMGTSFSYLDGSSKNRLETVKRFNEDPNISVFLVSLKAGGTGLNLVGADTVIHYDMWWNPAVENQATDRVYRMGQNRAVSKYKLVTLGTIEEKILSMQERKKGLVKDMIHSDEEALSKLSWEDVLELLQT